MSRQQRSKRSLKMCLWAHPRPEPAGMHFVTLNFCHAMSTSLCSRAHIKPGYRNVLQTHEPVLYIASAQPSIIGSRTLLYKNAWLLCESFF